MEDDEEALLAQAIALSMQEANMDTSDTGAASAAATTSSTAGTAAAPAAASTSASTSTAAGATDATAADIDMAMADPDFINSLLAGVPGAEGNVDVSRTAQLAVSHSTLLCYA